jgi:hypothetical protein
MNTEDKLAWCEKGENDEAVFAVGDRKSVV